MVAATLDAPDDLALVRDAVSFRSVFDAQHDFVWRALVHLGVAMASVDDAVQEVFLVVHRRLPDYDSASPMRAWLWGIARNVAQNLRRTQSREARKRAELARTSMTQDAGNPSSADRQLVLAALARLDDTMREALVLCDVEGFSAPELGTALGVSPNTISSRLRIARQRFADAVADLTKEGAPRS